MSDKSGEIEFDFKNCTYKDFIEIIENADKACYELEQKLQAAEEENKVLREHLEIAANQLEGASLAIKAHGQNINTGFFIVEYKKMADQKRQALEKVKRGGE